jgi:hypothetical protein
MLPPRFTVVVLPMFIRLACPGVNDRMPDPATALSPWKKMAGVHEMGGDLRRSALSRRLCLEMPFVELASAVG